MAAAILTLVCLLVTAGSENLRSHADPQISAQEVTLDNQVMRRSLEELEVAKNANLQAGKSAKEALVTQQNFLAVQAVAAAEPNYAKVKALVPESRAQLIEVRRYYTLAAMYAKHAQEVLAGSRAIPQEAAQKALEATNGWVMADAAKTADSTSKVDNTVDRLAVAAVSAAEPYHLALLRNQKFCAETYAKAKSAHASVMTLMADAKVIALKAQEMQALGTMGLDAQQTWATASGMMSEAESLRLWGNKLYGQANTACGTAGGYEMLEQQAAANAAATTIINAPMKLPPMAL